MRAAYLDHFGLRELPFRITPHIEFFFSGAYRGSTLEALIYAITHDEGIVKVSGEVGSGKTMLCRMLIERLPKHVDTVYLSNPSLARDEILYVIAEELKITLPEQRQHFLLKSLEDKFLEIHAANRQMVLMIDEAHAMASDTLEEIRLLSNLESNQRKLLHIVLFGQPDLDKRLLQPEMRQLKERITHNYALEPLHRNEISAYLMFRMRTAGYRGADIFTENAIRLISQASEGLARRINILADKALLSAFSENKHQVDSKQVKTAIADAQFNAMHPMPLSRNVKLMVGAAIVVIGFFFLFVFQGSPAPAQLIAEVEQDIPKTVTANNQPAEPAPEPKPKVSATAVVAPVASIPPALPVAPTAAVPPPTITAAENTVLPTATETRPALTTDDAFFATHFEATDEWLKRTPETYYFIQLMSADARNLPDVKAFISRLSSTLEPDKIRIYRSKLSGKDRIGVIYGEYPSEEAANADLRLLIPKNPESRPYIRSIKKLR